MKRLLFEPIRRPTRDRPEPEPDGDFSSCLQAAVVLDAPGGLALELDSDMADITQSFPTESMLGGEGDVLSEMDAMGGKLAEHDAVSASSQLASTLGINPHTLQVESELRPPPRSCRQRHLDFPVFRS